MQKKYYYNPYYPYQMQENDQRFIGPLLPFVGGALIGYIAGRPNFNNYPAYPVYYPMYYYTYYGQQPYSYNASYQQPINN